MGAGGDEATETMLSSAQPNVFLLQAVNCSRKQELQTFCFTIFFGPGGGERD